MLQNLAQHLQHFIDHDQQIYRAGDSGQRTELWRTELVLWQGNMLLITKK